MNGAYLHLGIVYLVWGSTYLAIRVAVREGSGFPPFSMGASRVILAGLLLLGWAALSRKRVRQTGRERPGAVGRTTGRFIPGGADGGHDAHLGSPDRGGLGPAPAVAAAAGRA